MFGCYVGECGYYSYCKVYTHTHTHTYRRFVGTSCLRLFCCFLTLKTNPTGLSETSIITHQTTQCQSTKQTLRRLWVSENSVSSVIFARKREERMGKTSCWWTYNFRATKNNTRMMKTKEHERSRAVFMHKSYGNAHQIVVGYPEGQDD